MLNSFSVDNFKKALKRSGMTQRNLAGKIGVSAATINYWVKGTKTPTNQNIEKVAKALGVSGTYLRGETKYKTVEDEFIDIIGGCELKKRLAIDALFSLLESLGYRTETIGYIENTKQRIISFTTPNGNRMTTEDGLNLLSEELRLYVDMRLKVISASTFNTKFSFIDEESGFGG